MMAAAVVSSTSSGNTAIKAPAYCNLTFSQWASLIVRRLSNRVKHSVIFKFHVLEYKCWHCFH